MNILKEISIENFGCFRKKIDFNLSQGTYLIGVNNAGKTVVLNAIRFFFDGSLFKDESFLNKTEYASKRAGANRSNITVSFNLNALNKHKSLKKALKARYGETITIKKTFAFKEATKAISIEYEIDGESYTLEDLPTEVQKLLSCVKITYLHPQEGKMLLKKAQEKLKSRLLANWGRHPSITNRVKDLQTSWTELRSKADSYLSAALTENLQQYWPDCKVNIGLPRDVENLIAISDITFQGFKGAPEIQLTSQGTGAQSMILYLTHFLLDSDRSLHTGEYHPVWLLEEPETFLHADLMAKLGKELNSRSWLENIQMVVSTHSPIILASSRMGGDRVLWNLIEKQTVDVSKSVTEWDENEIEDIGRLMGDNNFVQYFVAAANKDLIFIEDTRELTVRRFNDVGIQVTKPFLGSTSKCNTSSKMEVYEEISTFFGRGAGKDPTNALGWAIHQANSQRAGSLAFRD